jgi:hypothetical protein
MSVWLEEEVKYLQTLANSCIELSREYHIIYFKRKTSQNKFKIPSIIIGSFTGVASFGSSTFPSSFRNWISISVGLINVAIAILSTLESFLKLGEELNASKSASEQLKKLAEDINRELALEMSTRQTSGVIFLRDSYTRYQQILSTAPVLSKYISYLVEPDQNIEKQSLTQKVISVMSKQKKRTSGASTACNSIDIESREPTKNRLMNMLSTKHKNFSLNSIPDHLNYIETSTDSPKRLSPPKPIMEQQPTNVVPPTYNNIQTIKQAGSTQANTISKGDEPSQTNIEIEDDDAQSTVSSNEILRLKKLKQLVKTK